MKKSTFAKAFVSAKILPDKMADKAIWIALLMVGTIGVGFGNTVTIPGDAWTAYDIPEGGAALQLDINRANNNLVIDDSEIQLQDTSDTVQWSRSSANSASHVYNIGTVLSSREYLHVFGHYHYTNGASGSSGGHSTPPTFNAKVAAPDVDIGTLTEEQEESVGVWLAKGGTRKAVSVHAVQCRSPSSSQQTLSWSSGKVSLWTAASGGSILSGGSYALGADQGATYYAQGDSASGSIRDSEIKTAYTIGGQGTADDKVKLTVMGATLGSFATIMVNATQDVSVTLSPNPLGITNTLQIVCLSGTGSAQFTPSGGASLSIGQSATVHIKGVTASSVSNNMLLKMVMDGTILASNVFTVVGPGVEMNQTENPETICDDNTLSAVVQPSGLSVSSYRFESRQASGGNWSTITNASSSPISFTPRIPGHFKRRVIAVINGTEYTSSEINVETRFPDNATMAGSSIVEAQRSADWTAASGASGDHNERGGWIYLNTQTSTYHVDSWPIGTFYGCSPSANPADGDNDYFVGEYHLHATLRDSNDVVNASNYPTGPSSSDTTASNASDTPGLLRERHADEIIETGHTDYYYGPTRRTTPP